jgi:hypothetical protein
MLGARLRWAFVAAAAALLCLQHLLPPLTGLADQGDFRRVIGRFGFVGADQSARFGFLARTYVWDPHSRLLDYEQTTSEYVFVGAAVLLNKVVSKDGNLDITMIGLVHVLAFLYAFYRLLLATAPLRAAPLIWFLALLVLTDAGYATYWNSFYAEPASCIFFLLLLAESIPICRTGEVSAAQAARWALWAFLWVFAKPVNTPEGLLLVLFAFRLRSWCVSITARRVAMAGALLIAVAPISNIVTLPKVHEWSTIYDEVFLSILPESKNQVADAKALGLPVEWVRYSGTGAWSPGTNLDQGVVTGVIGKQVTNLSVARFYLLHPARIWRHAKRMLPVTFSLRPEWCGNFERSTGMPPLARSQAFSFWSGFHEHGLTPIGKPILIALMLCPFLCIAAWFRWVRFRRFLEFFGLLGVFCLIAFLVAICGDAWDNVKHLFLFNLLLDSWMVTGVAFLFQSVRKVLYGI